MIKLVREHLVAKLSLLVLLAVAAGFAAFASLSVSAQVEAMQAMNRASAIALARTVAAGVRNAMLAGDGLRVREFLDDAKAGLDGATIRVYATRGEEVFAAPPPPPSLEDRPPLVAQAIDTGAPAPGPDGAWALPIANEGACKRCHSQGTVRGVLTISTSGAVVPLDERDPAIKALTAIAGAGFIQIMTAEQATHIDDYFEELPRTAPGIRGVTVFDSDGRPAFGDLTMRPPRGLLDLALRPGPATVVRDGDASYGALPLPNEPRCQGCHGAEPPMRGALLVRVDAAALAGERTLLGMTETSLRHVMLSGLGRLLTGLLDRIAATGAVTQLSLHDAQGRLYHDAFTWQAPPPLIGQALTEKRAVTEAKEDGENGTFVLVDPLVNEARCQRCHGSDQPLRGAIEIALDTSKEVQSRLALERRSLLFAVVTIALVLLALSLTLRITVIRPVRAMGAIADQVGDGRLDVALEVGSLDEMGRLARHLNEMISGLRQKLALTRFVSKETVRSVNQADGAIARGGERRYIAVLFSDVRGFTAFSELHEPEQVVEMLNRVLHAQAEVVVHYGGDIDKFVGDELMARFDGPDCELRATRCAVELIGAVRAVQMRRRVAGSALTIGVGVNAGEVVLGAVGAETRMDFTAIGDEVNLAARLCSAAAPEQVLVPQSIRDAIGDPEDLELRPLPPILVKGKKDPIPLFEVVHTSGDTLPDA